MIINTNIINNNNNLQAEEEAMSNAKYFKHRRKPLQPDQRKAITKVRKQDKYDSIAQSSSTTTTATSNRDDSEMVVDNDKENDVHDGHDDDGDTEGLDALRTRIRQRIKDMQESRGYNKNKDTSNRQRTKNNNDDKNSNKFNSSSSKVPNTKTKNHKYNNTTDKTHESKGLMEDLMMTRSDGSTSIDSKRSIDSAHAADVNTDIDFGNIAKVQGTKDKSVGKPGSKMKRLKRMLEEATTKRQRIETLKSGNEQDVKRAKEEQWTDVLKIAAGESVVTDTKNIKKAIKKREKMKEKSAETWKGRLEKLETAKDEKLQKREENILKKQGKLKIDKDATESNSTAATGEKRKRLGGPDGKYSAAKKAAAANESPSRPGFEGKKVDFLNKKGRKG